MSRLIVEVVKIDQILPHPDPAATRIELAIIKGWQTVVPVGKYHVGDTVIYIPPDAMIPVEVSDRWGVTGYLSSGGRVKSVRLRGAMSNGFIVDLEPIVDADGNSRVPELGENVVAAYGIRKYEPPASFNEEDFEIENPAFHHYTDIERFQNFPDLFEDGEEVVITEKIHGTNSRVGLVRNEDGTPVFVCGSHKNQIRQGKGIMYEQPLSDPSVKSLLTALFERKEGTNSVVLFGEIYGWVQSLRYGHTKGVHSFRAFDISVDGRYLDWDEFVSVCSEHGVETVPVVYRGPFSETLLHEISGGNTTLGADHMREGVVVHPVVERLSKWGDRLILKRISDDYEDASGRGKISDSH